jgi:hypothetical protein
MLRDGYTWADVMMIRRKDADGIVDDLIAAAIAGHDVNANWIVSPANRQRFEQNTSG